MSILLVVLGGIMTSLVSATKAEADLRSRFESQQSARLGVSAFSRDVRCAEAVSPASGVATAVTLTLAAGCSTSAGATTWCTVARGSQFDLWRIPGAACDTSVPGSRRLSENLTSANAFTADATVHTGAPVSPSVTLSLTVRNDRANYRLTTSIYSRRAARQ